MYFTGWCDNLEPIWNKTSLLVHPSLHEGVPNIIMEALGRGVPVIASDIPEHRELLEEDELLFALDDPDSLALMLKRLSKDSLMLKRTALLCSERREKLTFDWAELACQAATGPLE
ncbi:MAG: glycosyltransferase [Candidatus Dadabacteria bacterium]|nr:MAG: glycosyltransferase [Candidatus Dadabacteria bacterium]